MNIEGANIPVGTPVSVRVVPTASCRRCYSSHRVALGDVERLHGDRFCRAAAGLGSMTVSATFDITPLFTQLNLPSLDGAPPVRVEVVANAAGSSQTYLIGARGSRVEMTPEMWTLTRASGGL